MKYVISVSKTYKHRGNHRHKRAKKHWHIYYYDAEWNFRIQWVNWLQALYYMTQKRKRIKYICDECGSLFLGLVKSKREKVECPYCD